MAVMAAADTDGTIKWPNGRSLQLWKNEVVGDGYTLSSSNSIYIIFKWDADSFPWGLEKKEREIKTRELRNR